MSNEFHWGGINGKSLCKAVLLDIWMVFAVMVITYLSLGIVGNMRYTPSYTSSTVVAVYPFNKIYTLDDSSGALETVSAVNEVFNSEMFRIGLKERMTETTDFSLYSKQIEGTYILMLSASSSTPDDAYKTLRTALDYYREMSSHLVGDSYLEILTEPDFPTSASGDSKILKYQPLLTLFMGFVMVGFLILVYVMRRTYKSTSAIRTYYKNVRFFHVRASGSDRQSSRNKRKSGTVPNQEAMRKTSLELLQMLRTKSGNSIFVTSATPGEGKTDITVSLAKELINFGKSVLIMETDHENSEMSEYLGMSDDQPGYMISDLLQDGVDLESAVVDIPDQKIKVVFANKINTKDESPYMTKDVKKILEQAEKLVDVILVDGCIWTGSREERIWKEATNTTLAVCRQDKADFNEIDQMMTDFQENNTGFLGCVLYGF